LTSCIAHTGSVKDISLILQDSNRVWFVSASQDQTLRLWKVNTREKNSVSCERLLKGHTKSVECVVSREGSLDSLHKEFVWLSSGSWDKSIRLWKLPFVDMHNTSAESSVPTNRKRKKKVASKKSDCQVLEPSVTLEDAHSHCVTCIAWPMEDIILSGSWDLSIKQWSVEKKTAISTVRASDVIQCMSYNNSLHLLATGHSDRCIRIWDFRLAENSVNSARALRSHLGWISSVEWHPNNEYMLLSGSYDKTLILWDIRSSLPLHTLSFHTDRILCACWDWSGERILSGGVDCKLNIWHMKASIEK